MGSTKTPGAFTKPPILGRRRPPLDDKKPREFNDRRRSATWPGLFLAALFFL